MLNNNSDVLQVGYDLGIFGDATVLTIFRNIGTHRKMVACYYGKEAEDLYKQLTKFERIDDHGQNSGILLRSPVAVGTSFADEQSPKVKVIVQGPLTSTNKLRKLIQEALHAKNN